MSVVDIDREERRSARLAALRAGEDVLPHPDDCRCHGCQVDAYYGPEEQR